jgi:hypothetical protein
MSNFTTHLKAAFENTTGIARSHGPQEAYEFADRMCNSSIALLKSDLDKVIERLRYTGDAQSAIEMLEAITKK